MNKDTFKTQFFYFLLSLIGGLLFASSFPSKVVPSFFMSGVVGIALYYHSLGVSRKNFRLKWAMWKTLFFSIGFILLGYYWIPSTIEIFGALPSWVSYLISFLFILVAIPQWFIAVILFAFIQKNILGTAQTQTRFFRAHLFAGIAILCELIIPQQFPTHMGHLWLHFAPYLFAAPYIGVIGYSFISYLLVFSVVDQLEHRKFPWIESLLAILILTTSLLFPLHFKKDRPDIHLRLVQANIGSLMKVDAERGTVSSFQEVFRRYESLSLQESHKKLDLIIWPETAYPETLYSSILQKKKFIPPLIKKVIEKHQAPLLTGGYDVTFKNGKAQNEANTAFLFAKDFTLKNFYHKKKLIPFGEGLPFGPLNPYLKKWITNISYFTAGEKYRYLHLDNGTHFITPICYEILFSGYLRDFLNHSPDKVDFILNLTNDSWYGDTSEPYQHLFLAQWRSLEFQLPLVRMTNTGITSITYPDGSESQRLTPYQQKILDLDLHLQESTKTFYQKAGSWPTFIMVILILGIEIFFMRRKRLL